LTNNRQQLPPGPQITFSDFMDKVNENPFNFLMDLIQNYGDIIYLKLQQKDVYILSNPDYIEQILTRNYKLFSKIRAAELRPILGNGLLLNEGDSHRQHRKILNYQQILNFIIFISIFSLRRNIANIKCMILNTNIIEF
jgi:cytochrome P450